jgi:hypothetical protein
MMILGLSLPLGADENLAQFFQKLKAGLRQVD